MRKTVKESPYPGYEWYLLARKGKAHLVEPGERETLCGQALPVLATTASKLSSSVCAQCRGQFKLIRGYAP